MVKLSVFRWLINCFICNYINTKGLSMDDRAKVAVLASGRGTNFQSLAQNCEKEDYPASIELLVTDNPDAGALDIAEEMGIESVVIDCGRRKGSMTEEASEEIARMFERRGVDLVCLAGFMRIVKGKLLQDYPLFRLYGSFCGQWCGYRSHNNSEGCASSGG
jgi:folate-dependent phosphoribosylglycinamide formyltransferase PurN